MSKIQATYYLPSPSHWPIVGSIGLISMTAGAANWLHGSSVGESLFVLGALIIVVLLFGWFGTVIRENRSGVLASHQVERSFRYGMLWFIFSEIMFFAVFCFNLDSFSFFVFFGTFCKKNIWYKFI